MYETPTMTKALVRANFILSLGSCSVEDGLVHKHIKLHLGFYAEPSIIQVKCKLPKRDKCLLLVTCLCIHSTARIDYT